MSNLIQSKVEGLFQQDLSKLTAAIDHEIRSSGMDPLGHLISGGKTIGSINLGICHAGASADFSIVDTTGISQLKIANLHAGTLQPKNSAQTEFHGTFTATGTIQNVRSQIRGRFTAGCGFLHPSTGIMGFIASNMQLNASGAFTVSVSGTKISITGISVQFLSLHNNNINIDLNGLGVFNELLVPLRDFILGDYKSQGIVTLKNMLSTPVNKGFQVLLT